MLTEFGIGELCVYVNPACGDGIFRMGDFGVSCWYVSGTKFVSRFFIVNICSSRVQEPFWLKALCVSNAVWRKKMCYKYCSTGVAVQWTSCLNYTKVHNNL